MYAKDSSIFSYYYYAINEPLGTELKVHAQDLPTKYSMQWWEAILWLCKIIISDCTYSSDINTTKIVFVIKVYLKDVKNEQIKILQFEENKGLHGFFK